MEGKKAERGWEAWVGWDWYDWWMMRYWMILICLVFGPRLTVLGETSGLLLEGESGSADFLLVADGGDLWQVSGADRPGTVEVLHYQAADSGVGGGSGAVLVGRFTGRVAKGGVAADSGKLWLVYEVGPSQAMPVQRISPDDDGSRGMLVRSYSTGFEQSLWGGGGLRDDAGGVVLRGLVVDDEVLWALVGDRFKTDRLMVLTPTGWVDRELPSDWVHGSEVRLVKSGSRGGIPWLVVAVGGEGEDRKWVVYRNDGGVGGGDEGWRSQKIELELSGGGEFSDWDVVVVSGQLVLGTSLRGEDGVWVAHLRVLREGVVGGNAEGRVIELGKLRVGDGVDKPRLLGLWGYVVLGQRRSDGELSLVGCDLLGEAMPRVLSVDGGLMGRWWQMADMLLMVGVFASSMLLMLVFWQRDSSRGGVGGGVRVLPEGMVVGELSRRLLAALIDFMPGALVSMVWFGLGPSELMYQWPGQSGGFYAMLPSVMAIGLFVVYTLVAELVTQQTVGKRVMGLRVVGVDGKRAGVGQIVVRNLLKTFDLIAVPLLLMPIVTPMRQRLGDLVARTLVVQLGEAKKVGGQGFGRDSGGDNDG